MGCEHKRIKSVNCVLYCMDCGQVVEPPKPAKQEETKDKPKRRAKKGATAK